MRRARIHCLVYTLEIWTTYCGKLSTLGKILPIFYTTKYLFDHYTYTLSKMKTLFSILCFVMMQEQTIIKNSTQLKEHYEKSDIYIYAVFPLVTLRITKSNEQFCRFSCRRILHILVFQQLRNHRRLCNLGVRQIFERQHFSNISRIRYSP